MSESNASRRSFLKAGALAAPLIAAPAAVLAEDGLKARLARLEDEAALRALHREWLSSVNAGETAFGTARSIAPDHGGADIIEVAADGRNATGRFPSTVQFETVLEPDCTLAEMAHAQGSGCVRHSEPRLLTAEYVKRDSAWAIVKMEFAA